MGSCFSSSTTDEPLTNDDFLAAVEASIKNTSITSHGLAEPSDSHSSSEPLPSSEPLYRTSDNSIITHQFRPDVSTSLDSSGQRVFVPFQSPYVPKITVRSAPVRSAPVRTAPVRAAPVRTASVRAAPVRAAPVRASSKLKPASKVPLQVVGCGCQMDRLGDELLLYIFGFVGKANFRSVAGTSRRFRNVYKQFDPSCTTLAKELVQSESGASLFCREADSTFSFKASISEEVEALALKRPYICDSLRFARNMAAWHGNLKLLKWAKRKGCSTTDIWITYGAAFHGHLKILQWLQKEGCRWDHYTFAFAATNGQLQVIQWGWAQRYAWDSRTCSFASFGGHLKVLEWVRGKGCPWDANTTSNAAKGGHLKVLQWARKNDCPWNESTCAYAAGSGHLKVLQWAHANGCPWDESTCAYAAASGQLQALQWARANGCPWNVWTCAFARKGGHLEVLQWAIDNGCPLDQ